MGLTTMVLRATGPTPIRLLVASFALLVGLGTCLLKLPAATPVSQPISWVDALFTATSAACVTGLVVRDTGTGFTIFGQAVILGLIQLGGLGVITFWMLLFRLAGGRLSLAMRAIFEQTVSGAPGRGLGAMLRSVFRFTLLLEGLGALVLFWRWKPELGSGTAAWHAVFHAVSAFCNAGFGLRPDNLVAFAGDPWVNATVMALIVLGGIGFLVLFELVQLRRKRRRVGLQSRLVLWTSGILIAAGAAAFWALEGEHSLAGLSTGESLLASLFQSISARTAGFNTVDLGALSPSTLFVLTLLMLIGASPGSCGGGMKTTTVAIVVLSAWARLRGAELVNAGRRTLEPASIAAAFSVGAAFSALAAAGVLGVVVAQGGEVATFLPAAFEAVSALGTVGLSANFTPSLTVPARLVVILLMFIGRVGPITLAVSLAAPRARDDFEQPREGVMVG